MDLRATKSVKERREQLENKLCIKLPHLASYSISEDIASSRNCENMIGAVQIPVGIAGPLLINSENTLNREFYVPLATTEGALVASVNRGMKAIKESGGSTVVTKKIGITRAPVFSVKNILDAQNLINWVNNNFFKLKELTQKTSNHLKLIDINSWILGKNVFLRFRYDTQDAMGMNMATIATNEASKFIETNTSAKLLSLSGNLCVDKKPNSLNFILGRGIQTWAEVTLDENVLKNTLKTNAQMFYQTSQTKLVYGSTLAETIGSNAQIANVLSAIFLATGQDLAHIAESSMGITTVEREHDSIYISVFLPDLPIGTVGGGTGLNTQKEALEILEVSGGNEGKNAQKFAEIIAGTVLAGEISLIASLSENSLSRAHEKLARIIEK